MSGLHGVTFGRRRVSRGSRSFKLFRFVHEYCMVSILDNLNYFILHKLFALHLRTCKYGRCEGMMVFLRGLIPTN